MHKLLQAEFTPKTFWPRARTVRAPPPCRRYQIADLSKSSTISNLQDRGRLVPSIRVDDPRDLRIPFNESNPLSKDRLADKNCLTALFQQLNWITGFYLDNQYSYYEISIFRQGAKRQETGIARVLQQHFHQIKKSASRHSHGTL